MDVLIGFVLSAVLQAGVFLMVCFICYQVSKLYWHRKGQAPILRSFWNWIGIREVAFSSLWRIRWFVFLFPLAMVLVNLGLQYSSSSYREFVDSTESSYGKLWPLGFGCLGLVSALFYSFLQTGFSEEVFFRGLIARKLIAWLGWNSGNFIQAVVFSLLHGVLLVSSKNSFGIEVYAFSVIVPFLFSLYATWLNRESGVDSIIPSILVHGMGNLASYLAYFLFR